MKTSDRDDPRYWLGRGSENVPGKPFGWAHNMEKRAIRDHLIRRGWTDPALHFRVEKIRHRLHRDKPTWRERQQVWLAQQPQPAGANGFTWQELERLIEHFDGANDPVGQSIATKAKEGLAKREP